MSGNSLLAIGRVMIGCDGQKADEWTVAVSCGPSRLRDSKRIDGGDARGWGEAYDFLPFQALVRVNLVPGQLTQFLQGFQCRVPIRLGQFEQVRLKNRIVEIEPYEFLV